MNSYEILSQKLPYIISFVQKLSARQILQNFQLFKQILNPEKFKPFLLFRRKSISNYLDHICNYKIYYLIIIHLFDSIADNLRNSEIPHSFFFKHKNLL